LAVIDDRKALLSRQLLDLWARNVDAVERPASRAFPRDAG
jgi:hypothetical protein